MLEIPSESEYTVVPEFDILIDIRVPESDGLVRLCTYDGDILMNSDQMDALILRLKKARNVAIAMRLDRIDEIKDIHDA